MRLNFKKIIQWFSILAVIFFFYCCKSKKEIVNKQVMDMPSLNKDTLWAKDTLGCFDYRNKQASKVLDNKIKYIGKSKSEIKEIFGKPNSERSYYNESSFVYYLGVSPDCEYIYSENLSWQDIESTTMLIFDFNKDGILASITWAIQ